MSPTFSGNYPTRSSRDHGHAAIRPVVKQQTHGTFTTRFLASKTINEDHSLIATLVRVFSAATSPFGCTSVNRSTINDRSKKALDDTEDTTRCNKPTELHSEAYRTTKEERKEPETLSKPAGLHYASTRLHVGASTYYHNKVYSYTV